MKNTKNTKGLLALAVASAIILVGCGGKPVHPIDPIAEVQPKLEDISDSVPTNKPIEKDVDPIKLYSEDIYFTSNLQIGQSYYVDGSQYDHSEYEHIIPAADITAMLENSEMMFEESTSLVSSHLSDKPLQYSDSAALDSLHTPYMLGVGHVLTDIQNAETTRLILINKSIDNHMNQVQPIENYTNVLEHIDEIIADPFHNYGGGEVALIELYSAGDYTLYLAPSSKIMSSADSIDSKLKLFNEFAEYFKTDDVQAIFAKYLNQ